MGDIIGGLIALFVLLLIIPLVFFIVLVALAAAGVGIALGILAALIGVALHLFFWALPALIVIGLLWLIFRPSGGREIAH